MIKHDALNRIKELKSYKQFFKYLSTIFITIVFYVLFTDENAQSHIGSQPSEERIASGLFLFSLWYTYKIGLHIESISDNLDRLEKSTNPLDEEENSSYLSYIISMPIWKIWIP